MNFKTLSVAALSVATLATVTTAQAGIYGRVSYNLVGGDTASDDIEFQRHAFAETTIGAKGSQKVGGITLGAHVEIGLNDGPTGFGGNTRNRIQEITAAGDFGKVSMGSGNSSSYVIDSVDSSGTWLADPSGWLARTGAGGGAGHSTGLHTLIRQDRLRYDSPKLGGVGKVIVSILEQGGHDIAVKVDTNGVKLRLWTAEDGAAPRETSGVLLGYKHASGFSISATSSESDNEELTSVKLGYQTGANAFSYQTNEVDGGSTLNSLTFQRKVAKGAFMWVRSASAEDTATEDSVFAIGGMVKF